MWEWMYNFIFLDLGTRWRWVVSFTPRQLYPQYPLERRLGRPQSRSGRRGEEKILDPIGIRTPSPRSSSPKICRVGYLKGSFSSPAFLLGRTQFCPFPLSVGVSAHLAHLPCSQHRQHNHTHFVVSRETFVEILKLTLNFKSLVHHMYRSIWSSSKASKRTLETAALLSWTPSFMGPYVVVRL
jgi:hypothetical protein